MSYLMPFDPMRGMVRMQREMDRLFRQFLRPWSELEEAERGVRVPSVDVSETENEVIIKAELPGIRKEDLDIEVLPEEVILRAQMAEEREEVGKEKTYHLRERVWGRFERTVPLPAEVKTDDVKAKLHEGILEIALPKVQPSKVTAPKRIQVE